MPLEIDVASNLYLPSEGDGDREAFARIFGDVWFTIPERFRVSMVAEWRRGISGQESSPMIQLVRGYRYAGGNEACGHTLLFNADVARLMQDRHLRDLIAHELGHVWHYAIKGSLVANPRATWNDRECEADRLAIHWGFDMSGLREWADAHGDQIEAMTGTRHVTWRIDCSQQWSSQPLWD